LQDTQSGSSEIISSVKTSLISVC